MADTTHAIEKNTSAELIAQFLSDQIFTNHVLTNEIFKHLNHQADLLNCSLVNKSWTAIFRNILRQRGTLLCLKGYETFEELENVTRIIENTALFGFHPFSGVKICFTGDSSNVFTTFECREKIDQSRTLLQRIFSALMDVTRVVLDFDNRAPRRNDVIVIPRTLRAYITALPIERLISFRLKVPGTSLRTYSFGFWIKEQERKFVNLKTLSIGPGDFACTQPYFSFSHDEDSLMAMLDAFPIVEDLDLAISPCQLKCLVKAKKLSAMKIFLLGGLSISPQEELDVLKNNDIRLTKLVVIMSHPPVSPSVVAEIIHSSLASLKTVRLHLGMLEEITKFKDFPILMNVTKLEVYNNTRNVGEELHDEQARLQDPLIRRVFPNLVEFFNINLLSMIR